MKAKHEREVVLSVRDRQRSVEVVRVGLRAYQIRVCQELLKVYVLGPTGVPSTRQGAIDRGLELAAAEGLLSGSSWRRRSGERL